MCLMAANVVLPHLGVVTSSPKSLSWIRGAISRRGKRGERKGRDEKRKEEKGWEKTHPLS